MPPSPVHAATTPSAVPGTTSTTATTATTAMNDAGQSISSSSGYMTKAGISGTGRPALSLSLSALSPSLLYLPNVPPNTQAQSQSQSQAQSHAGSSGSSVGFRDACNRAHAQHPHSGPILQFKLDPPRYSLPLVRLPPHPDSIPLRTRFVLRAGAPVLSGNARLLTNYPCALPLEDAAKAFDRTKFRAIPFDYDFVNDAFIEIDLILPGAFEYYIEYNKPDGSSSPPLRTESGFILVEPALHIRGELLPSLDAITLQTVVPKWLGTLNNWNAQFSVLSKLNFNMIHFVPLQRRGISNSPYSIFDQLDLDPSLFAGGDDGSPPPASPEARLAVLAKELNNLEHNLGILAMTDVVWNHTACNSTWLRDHPESGYNLVNSPHLVPAYEVDQAILDFSHDLAHGKHPHVADNPTSDTQLDALLAEFKRTDFESVRLWEYYVVDVKATTDIVMQLWQVSEADNHTPSISSLVFTGVGSLSLPARAERLKRHALRELDFGVRFAKGMDPEVCLGYLQVWLSEQLKTSTSGSGPVAAVGGRSSPDSVVTGSVTPPPPRTPTELVKEELVAVLNEINLAFYRVFDEDVNAIFSNIKNTVRWQRLDKDGPRMGAITADVPLVWSYFTRGFTEFPSDPQSKKAFKPEMVWANNGWIWNANPLVDFASPSSRAYLRREVIVWGDCVKLRYGQSRDDAPWLWDHMAEYTRLMAKYFHGFRIDNCHSTPIHVASYLLDIARKERPNLYVIAELFTGDSEVDRVFVAKLGINSLIREAMQAWDAHELSRIVHRYSGDPVGSFRSASHGPVHGMQHPHKVIDVKSAEPHALFMDCTHDNEPPAQKRLVQDTVANAALVAMTCCASGSVLGYDICIYENLNIVKEERQYPPLTDSLGMHGFRKVINELHEKMAREQFSEIYVHQEGEYVIVYRQDPTYHRGVVLIARTAFKSAGSVAPLNPVILKKTQAKLIVAQGIEPLDKIPGDSRRAPKDGKYIPTIPVEPLDCSNLVSIRTDEISGNTVISIDPKTPPGSAFLFETWITTMDQLKSLHDLLTLEGTQRSGIANLCNELTLQDIGVLLFQTEAEEKEHGGGIYNVPGYGNLAFCGLEGIATVMRDIMRRNDLGAPLCANIREGPWLMDYSVGRLQSAVKDGRATPSLDKVATWMQERFDLVKTVPNYLAPKYFSAVLMSVVVAARDSAYQQMGRFVAKSSTFVKQLALTSVQLTNKVTSASIRPKESLPALAAGLPHFSTNHMRCWGRDVFIALKGLYLLTEQYDLAKSHILAFGSTMRHGLIPNLLDSGRYPRYNARDAIWWWLQSVQDYCHHAPEGISFLEEKVPRRFPEDTWIHWDDPSAFAKSSTVLELVLEALQRHASGIHFREWNAGPNLDHAMRSEGFNVDAFIDWNTGFVCGGNQFNCGTWMDKMGDSHKAGNAGLPATPRDGAAVELQGLLSSCLDWLASLYDEGVVSSSGVNAAGPLNRLVTWSEWSQMLRKSFDLHFYIPSLEEQADYEARGAKVHGSLLQRRGIFKDTVGASYARGDYQFRPNQYIAMAVAPKLFNYGHAMSALQLGLDVLAGPLGMRTLDPLDSEYNGDYDNGNDSHDKRIAKGWNYHQGPEWLYPMGFFLCSYLHFASMPPPGGPPVDPMLVLSEALQVINTRLLPLRLHINQSHWAGLPELTNRNGAHCHDSCPTQAWSTATFLELEHGMYLKRETAFRRTLTKEMERACFFGLADDDSSLL
ncbi:hypothetical protein BCR44DRAFT_1447957 [Catenaria anguillulae PL171]|uniref:Glycogen debranching enzyme n=1 Tax=Catenaria anguillulae PL171 TaxID=765915 RepID=A0A1Y2H5C4_9FUNG|nr:hypothetical protein BCR44DRAFT_1447957 [Catenaria anguillulae PL171]